MGIAHRGICLCDRDAVYGESFQKESVAGVQVVGSIDCAG